MRYQALIVTDWTLLLGKANSGDVTHGDRSYGTTVTLQYQVNLVFRDSPLTRRNVCEQKDRFYVVQPGRQIADFLHVPVLNYVGPVGTMDAADAELRRLLNQTQPMTASISPNPRTSISNKDRRHEFKRSE